MFLPWLTCTVQRELGVDTEGSGRAGSEEWGFLNQKQRAAVLGRYRTELSSPGTEEAAKKDNLLNGSRLNSQTTPLTASNVAQA